MSLRRILAILQKDVRDAMRDGRIAVLLVLPVGLAIFYNLTIPDEEERPTVTVAAVDPGRSGLAEDLRRVAGRGTEIEIERASDVDAAKRLIADDDADLALVVPAPDGAARAQVLLSDDAGPTEQSVVSLVPNAIARTFGGAAPPPVQVSTFVATDQKPYLVIGQGTLTVIFALVMLVSFVAMMVVPMQTAEELETGTFGALRLAATGPEILTAKALAGFIFSAVGLVLTVVLTGLGPDDPVLFFGAALALVVSLVGFGLLLGLLVGNSATINTYGGFALIPVLGLATAVFFVDGGVLQVVLDVLPFSQATRLLGDGLSAERPFDAGVVSWAVIAAWAVAGYALLARIAARREL